MSARRHTHHDDWSIEDSRPEGDEQMPPTPTPTPTTTLVPCDVVLVPFSCCSHSSLAVSKGGGEGGECGDGLLLLFVVVDDDTHTASRCGCHRRPFCLCA